MNRMAMAKEISARVPLLADLDKDKWKKAEDLRSDFVRYYTTDRILALKLDEYVIGKGGNNHSFCYRIEREMDSLGRILGATAFKFGVFFGHIKSDPVDQYRFRQRWGNGVDEAFVAVKRAISDLLEAASLDDQEAIVNNRLSPMFKGKLLFLFHPDAYAPIYAEKHLRYFISALNLGGLFRNGPEMQRALMVYRAGWPEFVDQSPALYMHFLYELFGYPPIDESDADDPSSAPLLNEALAGAEILESMPSMVAEAAAPKNEKGKVDQEKKQRNNKRVGDRGEAIVLDLERKRLTRAGRMNLAKKIEYVAEHNDGAGFDILSFDEDGTKRPIEVKSTSSSLDPGFYLTINELNKSKELTNYHIYFVFSATGRNPRIFPMKEPQLDGPDFSKRPLVFYVMRTTKGA
jgi:hypothetical protein